jgi:hypothetical protein
MNGRLIGASSAVESSHLARSAASFSRWSAMRSLAQVDAGLAPELLDQPVHDPLVEVLAAEVGVAGGRADLEDALVELEDRDVEGAAAQVVDRDGSRVSAFSMP